VPLYWISQTGDNPERLAQAFRQALQRSDLVITTGGLGPTDDDQTREAIASVLGESPEVDPELERSLRERFAAMGRDMPTKNLKQAWLIPSAEPLANPLGTAPGWWVTRQDGRHIGSMPGVPSEMRSMWVDQVRPRVEAMSRSRFKAVTLKTFGAGESAIEERLGDLVKSANPSVATYAKRDGVYVRIAASATDHAEAEHLLQPVLDDVKARLGSDVFGSANDSLSSVVGALLQDRQSTVATAESITGGLVASYLTDVPGSSQHVKGGLVAYNEDIKRRFGVPPEVIDRHGVVSEQTALALADSARRDFSSDYGIGTTGAAGPDAHGGEKPGTAFIAVVGESVRRTGRIRRIAPRETVKFYVALSAIDLLRRVLEDHPW
jgi:nicotinamide-nucleotide amidase